MKRNILSVAVISTFLAVSACTTEPTKQDAGMVIGGILGGVLGSQIGHGDGTTAAIIIGTMLGGAIGGAVGKSMDDTDRLKTAHALETVRTGVPSQWRNPDSGNTYAVVPTKTYETSSGPCREYMIDATIGGKLEKVYGTACRQEDGSWKTQ
jgi:surface antigen